MRLQLKICLLVTALTVAAGDPQSTLVKLYCNQNQNSSTTPTNDAAAIAALNSTLPSLRSVISNSSAAFTFTSVSPSLVLYSLFQCRPYISLSDCLRCFSAAESLANATCPASVSTYALLDGCLLRFDTSNIYEETTMSGNRPVCGNRTASNATQFGADVRGVLGVLSAVTARAEGYFTAAERGGVFAAAQCVTTLTEEECESCLSVAFANSKVCLPNAEGRTLDSGCFMRYSDKAFFGSYRALDLRPYMDSKG